MWYKKGRPVAIIDFVTALVENLQIQVRLVFRTYVSCIVIPCPSVIIKTIMALVIIEIFLVNSHYRRIMQCGRLAFNWYFKYIHLFIYCLYLLVYFSIVIFKEEGDELLVTSGATYIAVVAIDFGTTFSGFAFAFNHKDGEKGIHVNKEWGTDQGYATMKAPTCLLLNPNKSFNSFGYEAQDRFAELEEEEAREYYYFEKFKMVLHKDEVTKFFMSNIDLLLKTKGNLQRNPALFPHFLLNTKLVGWCSWAVDIIFKTFHVNYCYFSIRTWTEKLLWRHTMGETLTLWPYSHIQFIICTRKLLKWSGRDLVMKTSALVMCNGCWLCRQSGSQQQSNSWEKQHIK